MIKSSEVINSTVAILIGFLIAIILAQIHFFKLIASFSIGLIFKPENWWMRAITLIIILGALAFAHVLSKMVEQNLKKSGKKKEESELKQKVKEVKALSKEVTGID